MKNSGCKPGGKLYEDYEQALLQLALHEAAAQKGSSLLQENQQLKELGQSLPTEEAFREFAERLDAHIRTQKADSRRKRLPRILARTAVAAIAVCLVFFTAVTTSQAFRAKVMNLWMGIQEQYTIFRLKEGGDITNEQNLVVDWTSSYVPTYVPEEYKVTSVSVSQLVKRITFEAEKSLLVYMEMTGDTSPAIDTENATRIETVNINGLSGLLVEKNGLVTVVWSSNERMFMIQTQADIDTAMKVAEGVKFIK